MFGITEIVQCVKELGIVTIQALFPIGLCIWFANKISSSNTYFFQTHQELTKQYHNDHVQLTQALTRLSDRIEDLLKLRKV